MRLLIQRVTSASVDIDAVRVAQGSMGLLVLVGFGAEDEQTSLASSVIHAMAEKMLGLRIFPGSSPETTSKMHLSVQDIQGSIVLVPQFTLYADCHKGRRPSFSGAAAPNVAQTYFSTFVATVKSLATGTVSCGVFGAEMHVNLNNWGPVTILLDSAQLFTIPRV